MTDNPSGLDRWLDEGVFWGLVAFVAAVQFSIAAAETLLALTIVTAAVFLVRAHERLVVPTWFWPLAAYAGLTVVSAVFSLDHYASLGAVKQLLLYLVVPLVGVGAKGPRARKVMQAILTVGAISALVGVVEYGVFGFDNLHQRPRGTLGHYMTYSGLLMLVLCSAAARLLFERKDWIWPALIMPALAAAVALTFSRNAWVGACVGIGVLLILKDFRLLALAPVAAGLFFALAPPAIVARFYSAFDLRDPTVRDRVAMYHAGFQIVKRYPLLGTGPNVVHIVYPTYRGPDAVDPTPPHLHNVPLQIAAERGLPALGVWLWFLVTAVISLVRQVRAGPSPFLAAAGIGAVAAMLAGGFFEYNFGDSEFLMLFLVVLSLPWANRLAAVPPPEAIENRQVA